MRTDRRPTCGSRERPLWFVGKSCHSPELRAVSKMRCRRFVSSDRYTHPPGRPRPWNAPPPLENDTETITRARPSWNAPRCAPPERARRFRVRPLDPGDERRPRVSRRYDRLRPPRSTADSPTRRRGGERWSRPSASTPYSSRRCSAWSGFDATTSGVVRRPTERRRARITIPIGGLGPSLIGIVVSRFGMPRGVGGYWYTVTTIPMKRSGRVWTLSGVR